MDSPRILAIAAVSLTLIAAGCGASSKTSSSPKSTSAPAAAPTSSSSTTSSSSSQLGGKWSGQYSGAYSGSFDLTWAQSGSKLAGTIHLNPGGTDPIHGSISGGNIKFGTVGGPAITYTGTVSGSSMSGNYQTPRGGGSWSANKS